jgi:hypothetical protein
MPLSVVGTSATYDNGGASWTTTTLTQPAGAASGDLSAICFSWYENANDTGLNLPTSHTERTNTIFSGSGSLESRLGLYTQDLSAAPGNLSVGRTTPGIFASVIWPIFRGSSALTFASLGAVQTSAGATSIAAPSVSGTAGQGLLAIYALSDPGSAHSQSEGMTLAVASPDNTNNCRIYYETLSATGATGTRTLTWTTSRDAAAVLMLIDGAGTGAANNILAWIRA